MRYIWVQILMSGGRTQWFCIPWGKKHLDAIRKQGVIINYHD